MTGCGTETLNAAPASTKNQLPILTYDSAGNVTSDGLGNQPTYDTENRMATDVGVTYSYDADGNRIEKSSGTMYWPGQSGDLAETDLSGTINEEYIFFKGQRVARVDRPSGAVHYYFSDHLQSTSIITNNLGVMQEQYYYYPYGGTAGGSGTDPNHYKFTGKERDSESGLDNFGARYNASSMGRFMTPDPLYIEAHRLADPQRLNLYAYARNNPVTLTDPNGLDVALNCDNKQNCQTAVDSLNNRKGAQLKVELGKDGKLHVVKGSVGKNLSKAKGALMGAINDTKNHATLNVSGNTGQSEFGTHDDKGVNSVDMGNLSKLDAAGNAGGLNSGDGLAHETMDAYYSLSMGEAAADEAAAGLFPGLFGPTDNQNMLNPSHTALVGSTFHQAISNGSGTEHITIQYITPGNLGTDGTYPCFIFSPQSIRGTFVILFHKARL